MGAEPAVPDRTPTSAGSRQPLSARLGGVPIDETWHDGIPAWIDGAVREWLGFRLHDSSTRHRLFARLHYHYTGDDLGVFETINGLSEADLLDWIDGVLNIESEGLGGLGKYHAERLEIILREGHSGWMVTDSSDSLERRQNASVTAAAHQATQAARSRSRPAAADHLENAWREVYGLHPDPSKAFGEVILAVEAVAVPAIVPNKLDATLGDVYGQLRMQGHLYELVIPDKSGGSASVEPVTALVGLLWHGHTDRHEGNIPGIPATQQAAEMAVHGAATLVQWFSSSAVRRK
jgi:hypothetical protein